MIAYAPRLRRSCPASAVQAVTWLVVVVGCPAAGRAAALRLGPRPAGLRGGRCLHDRPLRQLFADPAFWQAARNTRSSPPSPRSGSVLLGGGAAVACSRNQHPRPAVWSRLLLTADPAAPVGVILGWNALYGPGG